jgi:hypothetical protein
MAHCKTTLLKQVTRVHTRKHPEIDWMLERPSESHDDGWTTGYFLRELRSLLRMLDYHTEPLYIGKKTPLHSKGYKWEVHVVIYEKLRGTGERRVCLVYQPSAPRATFTARIRDAARQAVIVLRHLESAVLRHTQYHRHFLLKETDGSDVRVNDKVHNDPTGRLGEQVRLTMAMVLALT